MGAYHPQATSATPPEARSATTPALPAEPASRLRSGLGFRVRGGDGVEDEGKSRAATGQWQLLNLHLETSARLCKRMSHSWLGSVSSRLRKAAHAQQLRKNLRRLEGGARAAPREPRAPYPSRPASSRSAVWLPFRVSSRALASPPRARHRNWLRPLPERAARSCGSEQSRGRARRRQIRS